VFFWPTFKPYEEQVVARLCSAVLQSARTFFVDQNGASIIVIALAIPVLIGAISLAVEVSYWQFYHRSMQNAADSAAIAAATNAASNYSTVAQAVAGQYGFQNGTGNVRVSASNPISAAGCTANCYVVTISDEVPLFLSQVVGYTGSVTANNQHVTVITATSVATAEGSTQFCILALAGSGAQGITSNGAPEANLSGCNIMSDTSATCNGHNLNAAIGDAHGTNNGCGVNQNSNVPTVSDPYSGLASNIPANTCGGSYPQEPAKNSDPPLPAANQWAGMYPNSGVHVVCGDQQLIGNTTINHTVLVIENGQLDTNGFTLEGSALTIIFTGSNSASYQHIPTGSGTLNIAAPTSGTWSGVAIYQDPNLNTNVNISAAGNSPTWNISGLVYLPHSSVTFSGAVNKSASGANCFGLVVDNITINGTGSIYANDTQCSSAGLTLPEGGTNRGTLVN
jgi:Flp pilus assembly protein TadG